MSERVIIKIGHFGRDGKHNSTKLIIGLQRWCHLHEMNMIQSPQFDQLTLHKITVYSFFFSLLFGSHRRTEVKKRALSQMDKTKLPLTSLKNIKFYSWIIIRIIHVSMDRGRGPNESYELFLNISL